MTITRQMLDRVLDHYRNVLMQKFPRRLPTPAGIAEMEAYLAQYQSRLIQRETHPAWSVALKILCDPRTAAVDVTTDPQTTIEIQ